MRTVPIKAERSYQVEVGVDWKQALDDWCEGRSQVVIICSEKFEVDSKYQTIRIADGEAGKELSSLEKLFEEFSKLNIGRDCLVVAIGGGAVTDVSGFAAATWLRGIDWIAIPTTLAGMVDAAIGGKTGINHSSAKNLIGAFHSPISVLIDLSWLHTLTSRDLAAGLAEVVKAGFIKDSKILDLVELIDASKFSIETQNEIWVDLIQRSVSVKAEVVTADFKESFEREILNYGHTLGHAIEKHSNFKLRHGEAIAIGLCFAAELSAIINGLPIEVVAKHYRLLERLNLPVSYPRSAWPELYSLMKMDKKNRAGSLRFVGLVEVGKCNRIENPSDENLITAYERISS
jgi:3-dehydroquinate synthase